MRIRASKLESREYRCLMCFHVRAGTLVYGLILLVSHFAIFCYLTAITSTPQLSKEWQEYLYAADGQTGAPLTTSNFSTIYNSEISFIEQCRYLWLISLGFLVCTTMLVYGTLSGKSNYMLPFLAMQMFDFFVACLTVIGCFSYMVDAHDWVSRWPDYPCQTYQSIKTALVSMNPDCLMMLLVTLFVATLMFKAYLLGMVWNTHKYLRVLELERQQGFVLNRDLENDSIPTDVMVLPPKYEDAVQYTEETPPPPYHN